MQFRRLNIAARAKLKNILISLISAKYENPILLGPAFLEPRTRKVLLNLLLILAALAVPGAASAGNLTGRYATITLDGSLSDWQAGDVMYSAQNWRRGAAKFHLHECPRRERLQLCLRRLPTFRPGRHHQQLDHHGLH